MKIVVAGASGYIGRALIPRLLLKFPSAQITALSRSQQKSGDPRVTWKACDLFSLKSLEEALPPEVDLAYYLVHSMGPTAQMDQGSFADYDLILADNFARAVKKLSVKQVIYLGGLVPTDEDLSLHLRSRLEVEQTFREHGLPITIFRAGLILGEEGSSFQILLKLVKRLPIMVCPLWTQSLTTPVDWETVVFCLTDAAAFQGASNIHLSKVYDLAGCRPLSYVNMMQETARRLKLKRLFVTVPFFTPFLSRLWVSLITNTPKALVYPLVESLQHDMVARPDHLYPGGFENRSYFDLLDKAYLKTQSAGSLFRFRARRKTVRSVQRLPLGPGQDAHWIKCEYARWLPYFARPWLKVSVKDDLLIFSLLSRRFDMLELHLSAARSQPDRQLMYIKGGLLAGKQNRGRLEFRVVLNRQFVLAAIHEFNPALPWFIYKYTQAVVHLITMRSFARHLRRLNAKNAG